MDCGWVRIRAVILAPSQSMDWSHDGKAFVALMRSALAVRDIYSQEAADAFDVCAARIPHTDRDPRRVLYAILAEMATVCGEQAGAEVLQCGLGNLASHGGGVVGIIYSTRRSSVDIGQESTQARCT